MTPREYGQYCGVTRALELVGERWAMLIVRDLLVGPRRYGELTPDRAIETGVVEVLHGQGDLLGRFASTFHLAA